MVRKPKAKPALATHEDDVPTTVATVTTKRTTTMADANQNTIIELDMNLEDYPDFEVLPKGSYLGACTVAEVRTSDSGNQYFYTMWRIPTESFPADYSPENAPEGLLLNYSRIQVPTPGDRRSITNVKKMFAALGLKLKTNAIDPSQWVGQRAKLQVGAETWNGELRNNIISIEHPDA